MDYHPGLVPYNLNTIDKIIEKCKDKVPEALLETLKELPNKYANPDKLPSKILEILGSSQSEGIHSIRITNKTVTSSSSNSSSSSRSSSSDNKDEDNVKEAISDFKKSSKAVGSDSSKPKKIQKQISLPPNFLHSRSKTMNSLNIKNQKISYTRRFSRGDILGGFSPVQSQPVQHLIGTLEDK